MPIIRGPDGKPIETGDSEEATRKVERRSIRDRLSSRPADDDDATHRVAQADEDGDTETGGAGRGGPDRTGPARSAGGGGGGGGGSDEPKTQLMGARRSAAADAAPKKDGMDDPVVGWLVVVDGPGKGVSVTLGYGMNSIGRSANDRVALDYGDQQISRTSHAVVTYDPRGRKYFVQHGGGKNLTYMGDQPVLTPVELKGGEEIMLGDTKLRFVPFCGKDFDWRDQ
jgi:FHA domain